MKKFRIFAMVLAVVMVLATVGFAAWYDGAVQWAQQEEIAPQEAAPNDALTHGKLIGALYAAAKAWDKDVSAWQDVNILSYDDAIFLPEGAAESFQWACSAKLIAPDARNLEYDRILSREEMVDLVYKFAGWMELDRSVGEDTNILSYDDAFDISEGKFEGFQWACGAGLIIGTAQHVLQPLDAATNAQLLTVLMRMEALVK